MGKRHKEQNLRIEQDWSKVDWPTENYDYEKNGRLIWTEKMYEVIEAVDQGNAKKVLPHVPKKLLCSMIFNYTNEIDSAWFMDHGLAFIQEFRNRNIPLRELLSLLPDIDNYQSEFTEKYNLHSNG